MLYHIYVTFFLLVGAPLVSCARCESFSSYPRTYDLIHGWQLPTLIEKSTRCQLADVLLELDRLVRPKGTILIVDDDAKIGSLPPLLGRLPWDVLAGPTKVVESEGDTGSPNVLLVLRKRFPEAQSSTS